ncbi:hypothetical protein DFH09DRAFT_1285377 [Mycena vulgaris]|nr:hypothetical protein DFH09DRAFT_1285377 [Mycena vulgaris]
MGYGRDQGRKQEEESEEKIRVSSTGGPGSKASENAGERRGNKAWSARWELGPRRRLRACGEGSAGGRNSGDGGSPCAAQGREKRREAGALESGDNRSEDSVWRRRREAHGLSTYRRPKRGARQNPQSRAGPRKGGTKGGSGGDNKTGETARAEGLATPLKVPTGHRERNNLLATSRRYWCA